MASRFVHVHLDPSEQAEETWINPDHVIAVTPDPRGRYMTVVLDVLDPSGFGWGPKLYKITVDSGHRLLGQDSARTPASPHQGLGPEPAVY